MFKGHVILLLGLVCKCLTQIEGVVGGKAVGRWQNGMVGWDDGLHR